MELRQIVVPTDFSEHSARAVEYAIALARASGATIHLVHALHFPTDVRMTGEWWATLRAHAVSGLDGVVDRLDESGVSSETHLSSEQPVAGILELIAKVDADLVVMGSRGHGALPQLLLGSCADRIIRLAPCPVMTVRAVD
jgi:nucleotide-binding universal stress UspA family protein